MEKNELSRRDFHRFTGAAFGGMVLGAGLLKSNLFGAEPPAEKTEKAEVHVCRGLNTCKGAANTCAGTSACATAEKHTCKGDNACKGQGGCGETAGQNACKGMGACGVPLKDSTWAKARKHFEVTMKAAGKKFGPAPKKS